MMTMVLRARGKNESAISAITKSNILEKQNQNGSTEHFLPVPYLAALQNKN